MIILLFFVLLVVIIYLLSTPESTEDEAAPSSARQHVYALPFQRGEHYTVCQSYGGGLSHHEGTPDAYAIDFALPVGTPICAIREGVVRGVENDADPDGTDGYANGGYGNCITVLHGDGTAAGYNHLRYHGVIVRNGQRVKTGQVIGYSGDTGFSTRPHLHYGVCDIETFDTIPFLTQTPDGVVSQLERDRTY